MKRSSEIKNKNALYVISSPIGNLKDITLRALDTIKEVDYLFCEDTRVTSKLLKSYNIEKELDSYHDYSSIDKENKIISLLKDGKNVGIISDCGTPIISDPGFELVKRCKDEGIRVIPIPGASAQVAAITMSALPMKPYLFYGFLDHKESKKIKELETLKEYKFSMVFYESPLRINETIKCMYKVFGDRKCVLSREITKLYEESIDFSLSEYKDFPQDLKGEMVLVVEGAPNTMEDTKEIDIIDEMNKLINDGFSIKEASKKIASLTEKKSSDIYNEFQRSK